jgi:UDPglucose--hexose-1-phosphate uridylyltransferase
MILDWMDGPHRRLNRLTGEWVIVSAQRANRPWQGQMESTGETAPKQYDPECYLCPGNARAGGQRNPDYKSTFVFENDFPALVPGNNAQHTDGRDLFIARSEAGICKVVCFSPRHDLSLSQMELSAVAKVVDTWCDQDRALSAFPFVRHVQIFENRGAMMGASNPHPHCQIWASENVPNEVSKEEINQAAYLAKHGSCLLCDYVAAELNDERIVCRNPGFIAMVPFWAVWPFEILVVSARHLTRLGAMTSVEREQLADILQQIVRTYDALFEAPFPYTMGFHQQLSGEVDNPASHLHAHYFPPLLRSATVRKFMAGYELLATPQRDITPEWAADRLRKGR